MNYINDWADLHDPERARNTQKATENALKVWNREIYLKYIETLVEANLVENSDDIITSLENVGLEVHRRGKDYISIKDMENPDNKPFRLKGKLYGQGWIAEQYQRPFSREQEADRGHNT